MNKGPIKQNTGAHPVVPAFLMHLDLPKTAAVKDYLRTVDFESGEVNVHWSDERGDWVRQAFASRPDDVVVQLADRPERPASECAHQGAEVLAGNAHERLVRRQYRRERSSYGLQRRAADLQVHFGPHGRQQRLRRSGARGAQRRLGADGWRYAGRRKCLVGAASHPHRVVRRL